MKSYALIFFGIYATAIVIANTPFEFWAMLPLALFMGFGLFGLGNILNGK